MEAIEARFKEAENDNRRAGYQRAISQREKFTTLEMWKCVFVNMC